MEQFGITLFSNYNIGILLFITHVSSSLILGIILGIISKLKKNSYKSNTTINLKNNNEYTNLNNLGNILSNAILNSIKNILTIGGFIVLFSIIISLLNKIKFFNILSLIFLPISRILNINIDFFKGLLMGIIELTNGIYYISQIANKQLSINILFISFLLGFGGLSIFLQVLSIISKTDLSIKKYFIGKIFHGLIAFILTYLFILILPFFNFNL